MKKGSIGILAASFVALALALSSCNVITYGPDYSDAVSRWAAAGLTEYSFTYTWKGYGAPDVAAVRHITVSGGKVVSATDSNGLVLSSSQIAMYCPTVTDLLKSVGTAINGDSASGTSAAAKILTLEFDATYGYPSNVDIDWQLWSSDDEQSFTIKDFSAR